MWLTAAPARWLNLRPAPTSLGLWDFFSNYRLRKERGVGHSESAVGSVEYRRLTLEDKSTCIYFTHAWPSGHMDYPPAARWGDDKHNDRLMKGYLCARQRQPLTDSEITTFFASLKITDVDED